MHIEMSLRNIHHHYLYSFAKYRFKENLITNNLHLQYATPHFRTHTIHTKTFNYAHFRHTTAPHNSSIRSRSITKNIDPSIVGVSEKNMQFFLRLLLGASVQNYIDVYSLA